MDTVSVNRSGLLLGRQGLSGDIDDVGSRVQCSINRQSGYTISQGSIIPMRMCKPFDVAGGSCETLCNQRQIFCECTRDRDDVVFDNREALVYANHGRGSFFACNFDGQERVHELVLNAQSILVAICLAIKP